MSVEFREKTLNGHLREGTLKSPLYTSLSEVPRGTRGGPTSRSSFPDLFEKTKAWTRSDLSIPC